MSDSGGDQQARRSGGPTTEATTDATTSPLADHLAEAESVVYGLDGSTLTFTDESGEQRASPPGDPVAAVTDRRIYFAALSEGGLDAVEVPYRDVRDVEASGGLLRQRLRLRVWGDGTYEMKSVRGEPVEDAAAFVDEASGVWQRVLAATESAREAITEHGQHVAAGEREAAAETRRTVREQLDTARTQAESGPDALADALEAQIGEVETEFQRTRVHMHVKRCKTLYEAAEERAEAEAWGDAEAALRESYRNAEIARKVAALAGFPVVDAIEREFGDLKERAADIASRPRKLGGLAQVTAREATEPEAAVPAWAAALDHYRAAVSFDWGGRLDVERDTDALRQQVEEAAAGLIEARRELAANLQEQAAEAAANGETATAADHYEVALTQLAMAESVARELRAGDPAEIAAQHESIQRRFEALDDGADDVDGADDADTDGETAPEKPA